MGVTAAFPEKRNKYGHYSGKGDESDGFQTY
jgi:hypothetical protein